MRLELIRQNKLKITLAREELSSYGISPEAIAKNSDEAQAMFFSVLRKAEEEVGFVYSNSRLVVEAMPNSGGLVIYVTKVDSEAEQKLFDHISARQNNSVNTGNISARRRTDGETGRTSYMAELGSFDDVVEMCHSAPTYFGGTLYADGTKYYMTVGVGMDRVLAEYGRILDENAQTIIEEHATPIIYRRAFDIIRNRFKQ